MRPPGDGYGYFPGGYDGKGAGQPGHPPVHHGSGPNPQRLARVRQLRRLAPASAVDAPFAFDFRDYIRKAAGRGWGPVSCARCATRSAGSRRRTPPTREIYARLEERFHAEFAYMDSFPHMISTPDYDFVHGGIPEGPPETWQDWALMKNDAFLRQGRRFEKWIVVGHWPVMLYGENITCANPIVDRESRIVSIDGGCVLKDDGQLNALVIPPERGDAFSYIAYDPFPTARVLTAQAASEKSAYIRWGDNQVEVLERGEEFSAAATCARAMSWTSSPSTSSARGRCAPATTARTTACPSPQETRSLWWRPPPGGYLCKHEGVSGWYRGELQWN